MDRITQLQDEIQNVWPQFSPPQLDASKRTVFFQLLMIMANSINYLTTRANFTQVSPQVPITKQRNPDKFDPPDVFEGMPRLPLCATFSNHAAIFART